MEDLGYCNGISLPSQELKSMLLHRYWSSITLAFAAGRSEERAKARAKTGHLRGKAGQDRAAQGRTLRGRGGSYDVTFLEVRKLAIRLRPRSTFRSAFLPALHRALARTKPLPLDADLTLRPRHASKRSQRTYLYALRL